MDFPPPDLSMPPPGPPPGGHQFQNPGGFHQPRFHSNFHHNKPFFKSYNKHGMQQQDDFDGKRLRKSVMRKTVDYNASIVKALESRIWQRDHRDRRALMPENSYIPDMLPPSSYLDNPSNAITSKFVKTATNKMRCPIFCLAWTPEGRRLITGASSGEFTLWNGLTFNFETILQAHTVSVRAMVWSHNDSWMVTGDHNGFVKYWQSNMNQAVQFQAHKDPIRGISFCPTDAKFASCSDDGTVRIFDFLRCQEERVLRGHGADVKCVHWHPQKSLVVSGSKDNQQPIKLWDPKCGQALATLHAHKSTVMDLKWNDNGNWLITASRDHLLKLFDIRNLKEDMQVFRGHKKEASAVAWHPIHEGLFVSGGSDGQILFWNVGTDKEIGGIEAAHESIVWTLAWHPIGHILCSGSNDHTVKFWTRNRPGDQMRDKYNLNTLPAGLAGMEEYEMDDHIVIPGMGSINDERSDFVEPPVVTQVSQPVVVEVEKPEPVVSTNGIIPGLDLDEHVPRDIYQPPPNPQDALQKLILKMCQMMPGVITLSSQRPHQSVRIFGNDVEVHLGSKLHQYCLEGADSLRRFVFSGEFSGAPKQEPTTVDETPEEVEVQEEVENSIENAGVVAETKYDENSNDNGAAVENVQQEVVEEEEEVVVEPKRKRFKKEKAPVAEVVADDSSENGHTGRKTRSSSRWSSKR